MRTARTEAPRGRTRDYAALRSVLADHAATTAATASRCLEPAATLPGLLKLVAERAHYAGAEPVYRRYRDKQCGQQAGGLGRWPRRVA